MKNYTVEIDEDIFCKYIYEELDSLKIFKKIEKVKCTCIKHVYILHLQNNKDFNYFKSIRYINFKTSLKFKMCISYRKNKQFNLDNLYVSLN